MHCRRVCRFVPHASHSNNQWDTSSFFPDWHSWHLSFLGSPHHRPLSIIRGAVPPLNIIILHLRVLIATFKHRDSLPFSFSSRKVANLGLVLSSHVHSSSINLIAQVSNITLIYTLDRPRTSPAPTPHHPNDLRHSCSFIMHNPPHSIASIAAILKILPSYNGLDSILNQNAVHLTLASQATGTASASTSKDALGWCSPTPKRCARPVVGSGSIPLACGGSPKPQLHSLTPIPPKIATVVERICYSPLQLIRGTSVAMHPKPVTLASPDALPS